MTVMVLFTASEKSTQLAMVINQGSRFFFSCKKKKTLASFNRIDVFMLHVAFSLLHLGQTFVSAAPLKNVKNVNASQCKLTGSHMQLICIGL